jgi:hypothetical protein
LLVLAKGGIVSTTPDDSLCQEETYYTPRRVRALLWAYPHLLVPLATEDVRLHAAVHDAEAERVSRKRDLDRALLYLTVEAPDLYEFIMLYFSDRRSVFEIAAEYRMTERHVYRRISRGIFAMARFLGWRPPRETTLDNGGH